MVHVDHGHQVATALGHGHRPGLVAVFQTDAGVGHHHVVVLVLADLFDWVLDGLLVGVDPTLQVVDGFEVEGDGTDAEGASLGEGRRVATCHPDRGVSRAVWLGKDVVGGGDGEELAVEVIVLLLPHARNFADDLVPLGLGLAGIHDVEGPQFVAASASAGAELEPVVGEVVEHGGPLGNTDRVFLPGRETGDGRAEVDVVGLSGHPAHYWGRCRHVAVLGQAVVLAEPDVLPVVFVGEDGVLGLAQEFGVLALAVVGGRARGVAVAEDAEFHGCPPDHTNESH